MHVPLRTILHILWLVATECVGAGGRISCQNAERPDTHTQNTQPQSRRARPSACVDMWKLCVRTNSYARICATFTAPRRAHQYFACGRRARAQRKRIRTGETAWLREVRLADIRRAQQTRRRERRRQCANAKRTTDARLYWRCCSHSTELFRVHFAWAHLHINSPCVAVGHATTTATPTTATPTTTRANAWTTVFCRFVCGWERCGCPIESDDMCAICEGDV